MMMSGGHDGDLRMDRFDLGANTRRISTASPDAQKWFNLGLNWCYGFNQEEGVKCFRKALESDPDCLMAHWGIAYASGPFYNLPWRDLGAAEAAAVLRSPSSMSASRASDSTRRRRSSGAWSRRCLAVIRSRMPCRPRNLTGGTTIMPPKCAGSITNSQTTMT